MAACRLSRTYVELAPELAISVSVTQWLERLTSYHQVASSAQKSGSEIVFPRLELDQGTEGATAPPSGNLSPSVREFSLMVTLLCIVQTMSTCY